MQRSLLSKLGFWQQLVVFFATGITILAVSTSIVLTITANKSAKSQLTDQAIYLADSLARQARLSLLYQSPEEAQQIVDIALQYPDVVGIRIETDGERVLKTQGIIPIFDNKTLSHKTVLAEELEAYLVFTAPVNTQIEADYQLQDDFQNQEQTSQTLGYITLVVSKASLDQIWARLLRINLLVSTLVALPLGIVLLFLTRRLTIPLRSLSEVMLRAEKGELNLRAAYKGPRDLINMQSAFNTMMASLERQTLELKVARDEALESAKIKSEFAANVSHELRTPMNSVLGMLDLLSFMRLTGQQKEYIDTAKLSAQNLLALIDDILSYVRSDSGKLVLDETSCDLDKLVEEVLLIIAPQALKKQLDIGYVLKTNTKHVLLDAQRLRQTLVNLLGNAVKFTDNGEIGLVIDQNPTSEELIFTVYDTGVGIDEKAIDKIFDAFTQEDSTTTRKYGGTGLGLAICRQFVILMGGKISVESKKGQGSKFVFTLPLKPDTAKIKPIETTPTLRRKNIAVLDDSDIVRDFVKQWGHTQDACVFPSHDFLSFMELLTDLDNKGQKLDYIFIDEDMIGLVFDDIVSLAQNHPSCSHLEAVSMVNPWTKAQEISLVDYSVLEKPLSQNRLNDFIGNKIHSPAKSTEPKSLGILDYVHTKILVVDDNKANCLVAGGMLNQIGCEFETVHNGEEALELISRRTYDAVLMDCNMPVMDGYTATATIRKMESEASKTPILAMTANNSDEEKQRCLAAGMDDFIAKPLSIDILVEKLKKIYPSSSDPFLNKAMQKMSASSEFGKFDPSHLKVLKESVGEVFTSVIEAFVEDSPIYLESLKASIDRGDTQQVFELAHTIKGSSSNFGGTEVARIAKDIEVRAKSGDLAGVSNLYDELDKHLQSLIEYLTDYVQKQSPSDMNTKSDNDRLTVLIADDDRSVRMAISNNLRSEGYKIIEASNGQSVLAICSRSMPDLIIMDAIMPEMDGFSALKAVRDMVNGSEVPILMVTSLEDEYSITKAFKGGATDYISKPVNFSVLRQRISRLVQSSKAQKHVRKLAYQDVLTGLPNRAYFNQQLRQKINRAGLNDEKLALLFLDLDRFKLINDSLGHDIGDLVLKSAAGRIKNCLRETDLVARFGGDEFTIILEGITSLDIVNDVSKKIADSLSRPFVFLKRQLFVSVSIGAACFPENGSNASELIKNADNAMYKAKRSGGGVCFFESGMQDEAIRRFEMENDIRTALSEDEFYVVYQPQFDIDSGDLRGVEALVRWQGEGKDAKSTDKFLPIAEETGLITELGRQVFGMVCKQLKEWHENDIDLRIAVNVSGAELQGVTFAEQILLLLDEHKLPPNMLELEITESMLMEHPDIVQKELVRLRDRGISIAIDDFGSGFSSLIYLKNFSVDILKIDKEFIKDCDTSTVDQAIISGIIALAKTLELEIVAEGIENEAQLAFLHTAGCDYAQGYLLGKPVPIEQLSLDRLPKKTR
jgi:diguanylate cyclase (GGDEF)-like protein